MVHAGGSSDKARVVIVGAGPAGAATALLLARASVEVLLLERERDFDRVFRGEGLMPSGVDALLEMGLRDLLGSIPSRKLESWDVYIDGEELFSVPEPLEELGERAVRVVPQPELLSGVVAEAGRHASFRFAPGLAVRDVLRRHGRVAGVRVGDSGGEREIEAELVIGCDGRASAVRKRVGLPLDLLPEGYDVLWFKAPAPERLRARCSMMLCAAAGRAAACYTSWDGRLQLALTLPKGSFRRDGADRLDELRRIVPPWLDEHLGTVRGEVEGPALLDVVVGRCPRWSEPGVLLLGDAAHPMSPIRAQGVNVALRDAIVAANHLVPALRGADPAAIDAAARAVQAEREPEIVRAQTLQLRDARGFQSRFAPLLLGFARRVGRVGRFRWAQRAWLRAQHDLRFGSTEVRLRV